jgi:hypothetical protein
LSVVHDHALHERNVSWRERRQSALCGGRQSLGGFARSSGLNDGRRTRISLLGVSDGRSTEKPEQSKRGENQRPRARRKALLPTQDHGLCSTMESFSYFHLQQEQAMRNALQKLCSAARQTKSAILTWLIDHSDVRRSPRSLRRMEHRPRIEAIATRSELCTGVI